MPSRYSVDKRQLDVHHVGTSSTSGACLCCGKTLRVVGSCDDKPQAEKNEVTGEHDI